MSGMHNPAHLGEQADHGKTAARVNAATGGTASLSVARLQNVSAVWAHFADRNCSVNK